ncbi:MAG: carbamoyltransferase HypF [Oceanospirillaceae bacterium]|nr:carbamoyltransferase HypF [Oceanospirillaceae bacterium]
MSQHIAEIRIRGSVQGVGFRPCVWQLAKEMALCGEVRNDGEGLMIRLYPARAAAEFRCRLESRLPPRAEVDSVSMRLGACDEVPDGFRILASAPDPGHTRIIPDLATCPDCLTELLDRDNRHYRYPFTSCTRCGPRFSIIERLPYDRERTAMAPFPLCRRCAQDFHNPRDRRFHAQAIACPACGPRVWLAAPDGRMLEQDDAIDAAAQRLQSGELLAIKASGGFHLACDALDANAIARLRRFKGRADKPLAVMLPDVTRLRERCDPTTPETELLSSPAAPIVLVRAHTDRWPPNLLDGLDHVGAMLPATPLQHLLLTAVGRPLVMTSGNREGSPPCLDNDEALSELGPGVDALLLHDRVIVRRLDDSLAQVTSGGPQLLRRARGYAPGALALGEGFARADGLLALGGDLKNAPCLLQGGQAILGTHLGDVANPRILQQLADSSAELGNLFASPPHLIACDAHPGYHSRALATQLAEQLQVPLIEVQHHHAHLAACLAEHRYPLEGSPVLGLVLDGSGLAPADSPHPLWGGEFLLADYRHCKWIDGLPAVAMPGGERAAREPWRNLLAQLERWAPDWEQRRSPAIEALHRRPVDSLRALIRESFNAPLASSCGRLFDAVAALLGVAPACNSYEGQAAMRLEALARQASPQPVPSLLPSPGPLQLDGLWRRLLGELEHRSASTLAFRFHHWLAELLAARALDLARQYRCNTLVLGGGCLHNRLLRMEMERHLRAAGMRVLIPARVPAGDGGLALGQAVVGWAREKAHA